MYSKTFNTLHSCHNFPAGSRQAARGAGICEISLLYIVMHTLVDNESDGGHVMKFHQQAKLRKYTRQTIH